MAIYVGKVLVGEEDYLREFLEECADFHEMTVKDYIFKQGKFYRAIRQKPEKVCLSELLEDHFTDEDGDVYCSDEIDDIVNKWLLKHGPRIYNKGERIPSELVWRIYERIS